MYSTYTSAFFSAEKIRAITLKTSDHVDLCIIGAGIAGAALAAALADSGLRILLLERRLGPLDTARGDHIQPSLIPVLSRWGVLDALLDSGAEKRVGTRWFAEDREPIVTVGVPETETTPPWFLFLNHERIGKVLEERAVSGGADLISGVDRWELKREKSSWRVDFRYQEVERSVTCTLLVGADGTGSLVRSRLNIAPQRHRYQFPIAVLYGRPSALPAARTLDVYLAQQRMVSLIPRTGGWTKIGFPIDAAELAQWRDQNTQTLNAQLRAWCPSLEFEELRFGAIYPPVSLTTDCYNGEGAAVLLGDACHAMHPARSQGMNTCFRVADQLADRLRLLSPGFSEASVLPIVRAFDSEFRADLEPRLAENHAAGLQMDTLDGGGFLELASQLRFAAENPDVLAAMSRRAAGLEA